MLPEAIRISRPSHRPVILVIHVGVNDLCLMRLSELLTLILADLDRIMAYFAAAILVWLKVMTWQGSRDTMAVVNS